MRALREHSPPVGRLAAPIGVWTAAGYEDVDDADRLCRDPAMRWVVGDPAIIEFAVRQPDAVSRQKWLIQPENLAALAAQTVDR
jgi:hypothetical protein